MAKTLIIVESPNKCQTIKSFLPDNYVVAASVGHITKIQNSGLYNMGVDVNNDFKVDFAVDPEKKDIVKKLKELVKSSDFVYLASDNDMEGEAIAWHLKDVLKIADSKYKRITYHEITKPAIMKAFENARMIDENKAYAAITRASLDRIVGFRLSPLAMTKCSCKSAGRVQSAALLIIVLREKEIMNFVPEEYYEIWLPFKKGKGIYRAQYKGTDKKKLVSISTKAAAEKVIKDCDGKEYVLKNIESKERKVPSKPPFTTSTFQQEVASKLGYSTKKAMECAQKLFEGINLNGNHVALITYHRTDSTDLNDEFVETLNQFVQKKYGKDYYAPVKKAKKGKNTQDGHEAMHVIDLEMTPEKLKQYIEESQLIKVYKIIYDRTVACAMADCVMTDTEYSIYNGEHRFAYSTHSVKFPGFKAVYNYADENDEDENGNKYPELKIDEVVNAQELELVKKSTNPPARYTEASLIKKLEDTGIGRPSTYASTIATILDPDRGYVEKEGKSLKATDKGIRLSDFLTKEFGDIINLQYTSEMESKLDEIANGKTDRIAFLKEFYAKLCTEITSARNAESNKPPVEKVGKKCPDCGKELVYRTGKFGKFIACSGWSGKKGCHYTEKIADPNTAASETPAKPKAVAEDTGYKCPDCNKPIVKRLNEKTNTYWFACSGFPKHKKIFTEDEFKKVVAKQSVDKKSKDKS